jgi:hypothetical protein
LPALAIEGCIVYLVMLFTIKLKPSRSFI